MSTRRSPVWNVFTESKETKGAAICNICSQEFSFRTSTTNLLKHVQRKHPEINIILNSSTHIENQESMGLPELLPKGIEIIVEDEGNGNQLKEETESFTDDDSNSAVDHYHKHVSSMWLHFTKIETPSGFSAVCNVCGKKISYKTTSNLKKHLERIHPEQLEGSEEEQFILNDSTEEFSNKQQNSSQTTSRMWRFFTKIPNSNLEACCNLCKSQLSYRSTTFNLKRHLERKHPEVFMNILQDQEQAILIEEPFKQELEDEIKSNEDNFEEDQNIKKFNFDIDMNARRSQIWNVFTIHSISDSIATCNVCDQQFSYKSTTNDLKRHFQRKHPELSMENKIEQVMVTVKVDPDESDTVPNVNTSETDDDQDFPNEKKYKKHSILWNYFTKSTTDEYLATCNICKRKLCYKTTTTNLRKHLNSKHPHIQINLIGDQDQKQVLQSEFPRSITCDKNSDVSKKTKCYSAIWNYFARNKPNEFLATCNVCGKELCYRTSISNLKKHINKMHVDIKVTMDEELSQNQVNTDTETLHMKTEIDQNDSDEDSSNYQETNNVKTRQYSVLWNYFTQSDPKKYIAICNICQRELRYRTTSNLKKHLIKVHPDIDIHMEASKQSTVSQDLNENALDDDTYTIENTKSSQPNIKKERKHYSKLWNHFTRKITDECIASCNLCNKEIGYRTSTSNLKKHLIGLHPDIDFQLETEVHENQINLGMIKTCLICLENNRHMPKIFFQISNTDFQEKSYVTKIGEILNQDIVIDESHVICQSCIDDIEKLYKFKQKLTKSFDFWSKLETELDIETYKDVSDPTNDRDETELVSDNWVESTSDSLMKFTCDRCHQEFESATAMLNHTCTTVKVNVARKPIKLTCKFCGIVFNKHWKRDRHSKRCGIPVEKKFDCTLCEKSYKSAFLLREHMPTHTGERNYMCHFCGKTFYRASVRHKHMQSHNRKPGEKINRKPFLCFICGKTFPANVATRHMRVHSGIKRKECHICFKRFDQVAHLKVHLRTHSGERPYECRICRRRFSLAATLRKHMRLHVDPEDFMTVCMQQDLSIDTPMN